MIADIKVGPVISADGAQIAARATKTAALVTANAHGSYSEAVLRGNAYTIGLAGATPVAYAGAAAGTPLLCVHNPTGSGKLLSLLGVFIASRVAASAAGTVAFNMYGGASAQPTGTTTAPRNLLTLIQSGSSGIGFANAALTGSTALSYLATPFSYYWATAAGAVDISQFVDLSGLFIVAPGNQIAIGASAALTSATWDISMVWEEMPQ